MATRAHRIDEWEFSSADRLFLDANVWIFLFDPFDEPANATIKIYTTAYKRARAAGSQLFTDMTVLCEVVNRNLKLQHELDHRFGIADAAWKRYRQSEEYGYAVSRVAEAVQSIVEAAQVLDVPCPPNWDALFAALQSGQRDFNDELIVQQCQRHDLILVTDDGDFRGADLQILTNRSNYFTRRRA